MSNSALTATGMALALAVACGGPSNPPTGGGSAGGSGGDSAGGQHGDSPLAGSAGEAASSGSDEAGSSSGAGDAGAGIGGSNAAGAGEAGSSGAGGVAGGLGGTDGEPVCGNSVVENGEGCDDGNMIMGDGCSPSCSVEAGWWCGGSPSVCFKLGPSCAGLAKTCGPNGDADCCASNLVPGGTFYRGYDVVTPGDTSKAYPATVSDFRLDTYEVTVGRFRRFVAAYSQTMIAQGAGANPNNPSDAGWDTAWNASLETNATKLQTALTSDVSDVEFQPTWTANAASDMAESLPITGLDWYDAEAFCIWDGGRLPTEAEWNYAASGGTEQRVYPWGSAAPDATYAVYDVTAVAPVGSTSPKGDGKWGQADLAGNVFEWVQDWYVSPYANPCTNCAEVGSSGYKVTRGGGLGSDASVLVSSYRIETGPLSHSTSLGARCARSAP